MIFQENRSTSPDRGWFPLRRTSVAASALVLALVPLAVPTVADTTADQADGSLILRSFPDSEEWYRPPAAELIRAGVLERYGAEEWRAVVLSHELHQHIGIYTILGAKMGVRARELLKAPTRSVRATLETGGNGPMTCAADGIQASLASTFGQGLVHVESPRQPVLAGTFEYDSRRLRLTLKPEYRSVMQGYIDRARERHGDLSPAYFQELEQISYTVWSEFDRSEVFSVEWAD
jgi:pyrimidine-specific ribonucleoside hydrolase